MASQSNSLVQELLLLGSVLITHMKELHGGGCMSAVSALKDNTEENSRNVGLPLGKLNLSPSFLVVSHTLHFQPCFSFTFLS